MRTGLPCTVSVVIMLSFATMPVQADIRSDIEAIRRVIRESYISGFFKEGRADLMRVGFHPDFVMFGKLGDSVRHWSREDFGRVAEERRKKSGPFTVPIEHRFPFIHVTGDAAVACVEVLIDGKLVFTDYLSLYRFADGWKLVGKIYQSHAASARESAAVETRQVRAVLITGATPVDQYLRYNRTLVPSSLYSVLDECKDIVWDHCTLDEAAFQHDVRKEYDVAIFFNHSDALSDSAAKHLESFIGSGKGLIILHGGLSSYNNWERWWKDIVGGKYQMADADGFPRSQSSANKEEEIDFQPAMDHPITKAVGGFTLKDEAYKGMGVQPGVNVLYRTSNRTSDGPLVWIGPKPGTRVVVIQPGHGADAYRSPSFRRLLQESIRWAGNR